MFLFFLILSSSFIACIGDIVYPCTTPQNEKAHCKSLFLCPHLMQLLGSLEPSSIDFVKNSICLGCAAGDFMVCCGTPNNKTQTPTQLSESVHDRVSQSTSLNKPENLSEIHSDKLKLLPNIKYCGFQHTDDRFYNKTETALDEFPWLVHILLSNSDYDEEYLDRCNGVLISNRYVLTDAYCGAEGFRVRLGQYNTHKPISCIDDLNFPECTDPTIIMQIEERIRDGKRENGPYDFTLLRLAKTVTYTDFIRPICLPMNEAKRPQQLDFLTFSGWGVSTKKEIQKKRLVYDIVDPKVCYNETSWVEGNVKFANVSFICVFPQKNNKYQACSGEHGGPFMYSQNYQWFLEGVVVLASPEGNAGICHNDKTANGIRITPKTIKWILDSIRP